MVVMESSPPSNLGNLIIFFGVLLSVGVFMGFGVSQNMWGGVEFVSEGSLFAKSEPSDTNSTPPHIF